MIRIAIDCHKLEDSTGAQRAGIGRHVYKLLEELSKRTELINEFQFFLYFKEKIPNDIEFLDNPIFIKRIAKLPFFFPFFRPSFNIFFHIAIPFYALKDKINVTFFPSFMLPAFFPPVGEAKSIVLLTNDIYYEYTQGVQPLKYRIGYKLFSNWAARRATKITTQTYASRDEIVQYFNLNSEKISVVPLGVDVEQFSPHQTKEKKNYIFYIGQTFPRRHLRETILAFEKIAPKFPNLKFIAIGVDKYNPPIIDELVKKVNKKLGEERIFRFESVSDEKLVQLYQYAKLFIYISSSEAMGLPPLEALAAGTAPVVADTSTTREIFSTPGGECAAFFARPAKGNSLNAKASSSGIKIQYTPDSIASVLSEALNNKEKREDIIKNRKSITSKYTWEKHTDLMLELFKNVSK